MRLILASASPRRAELLAAAGIPFDLRPAHVDESVRAGEGADAYVRRVAEEKAIAVASQRPGGPVLGADTVVVVGGEILGKPRDAADAARMLRRLSGQTHEVMTGVCLVVPDLMVPVPRPSRHPQPGDAAAVGFGTPAALEPKRAATRPGAGLTADVAVAVTTVEFAVLGDAEISWYVDSGEPMDKAGAYAIQGLASRFVTRIDGSYSNVVGLPVSLVYAMCRRNGILLS